MKNVLITWLIALIIAAFIGIIFPKLLPLGIPFLIFAFAWIVLYTLLTEMEGKN